MRISKMLNLSLYLWGTYYIILFMSLKEEYSCLECTHTEETGGISLAQGLAQALSFPLPGRVKASNPEGRVRGAPVPD